jgi:superfamily II DNA or RNA helicase
LLNDLLSQEKDLQATYSMYIGTKMKTEQKKESLKSQIILATSQSFGEGIDKPDLNTLILTTPKKYTAENKSKKTFASISFVQIIGRIFRKEHHVLCPLIIDFWDQFSVYKNQGYSRRSYYTKQLQECEITTININLGEKEKAGSCAPKKEKAGSCVSQKEEDSPLLLDTLILD